MDHNQKTRIRTLDGTPYHSIDEFFIKNGVKAQLFTVEANRITTLVGKQGTRLTIEPFSFADSNGNRISGTVQISLKEVFNRRDMVRSGKVTTNEGKVMESGGQFFLEAYQAFRPLQLIHPITVQLPLQPSLNNPLAVKLYEEVRSSTRSFDAQRSLEWKQISKKSLPVIKIGNRKYFDLKCSRFGWMDCDYLLSRWSSKTMVSAQIESPFEPLDDQAAFLVFHNYNAVVRMHGSGNRFSSFHIPIHQPVEIIILGLKNRQLYFGKKHLTKTSKGLVKVFIREISEAYLINALAKLPA